MSEHPLTENPYIASGEGAFVGRIAPLPPSSFCVTLSGVQVMKIAHDGRFFWKDVEVEGGQEVRDRMLELLEYFTGKKRVSEL